MRKFTIRFSILWLSLWGLTAKAQLSAVADTIGVCAGTPVDINVLLNDTGVAPLLSDILIGPTHGTATFTEDGLITLTYEAGTTEEADALIYLLTDTGGTSALGTLTILIAPAEDCVWPGDANDDLIANHLDLLAIGLFYGDTGPQRYHASTDWEGQYSIDWEYPSLLGPGDRKFADANGDGIIDTSDITPILTHYGLEHARLSDIEGGDGFTPFGLEFFSDTVFAGAAISIPLYLGSIDLPASHIYGLAFTLTYPTDVVVPGSIEVSFNSGWLGDADSNLISLNRDGGSGLLDVSVSRINKTSITGYGHIGEVSFVMEDNLAGRISSETVVLSLCPTSPTLINAMGDEILADQLDLVCDSVVVWQIASDIPSQTSTFNLYPNPAQNFLFVQTAAEGLRQYRISNMSGVTVAQGNFTDATQPILLPFEPGAYVLECTDTLGNTYRQPFIKY